jgi:hypothetical protein
VEVTVNEIEFDTNPDDPNAPAYWLTGHSGGEVGISSTHFPGEFIMPEEVLLEMAKYVGTLGTEALPVAEEEDDNEIPF